MFHLASDGPFIFCNILHRYKRDHLYTVANFYLISTAKTKANWVIPVSLKNTHFPCTQGNPALEELGCLGTAHVKLIYPSQKILQQTWQESHENLILQGRDSVNIKTGNCCTCKTNRGKLAFRDKLWKNEEILLLRRLKAHCTGASIVLPTKTS